MVRLISGGLNSKGYRLPEQVSDGNWRNSSPIEGFPPEPDEQGPEPLANPSVASLSLDPTPGDVEGNLVMAENAITEAAEKNPSLRWVVLPELFTMGYADLGSAHRYAEDAGHGMSVWRFSALAHSLGVYIAYGFPELLLGGGVANSVNLVGPEAPGPMLTYRKIHLVETTLETQVFVPGSEVPVVEAGGARVAVAVCWDLGFPEAIRAAAHSGADLVLAPAAWREPWGVQYEISCAARALDNAVYVASANQQGNYQEARFGTAGGVFGPDGSRIAGGRVSVGEIDLAFPGQWRASYGSTLYPLVGGHGVPEYTAVSGSLEEIC